MFPFPKGVSLTTKTAILHYDELKNDQSFTVQKFINLINDFLTAYHGRKLLPTATR